MTPMPDAGADEPPIEHRRVLSSRRRRLGRRKGQAMVEFALIAPAGFLLLLSILVVGIIVTNYIQLTNGARDGARVAAICGSVPGTPMPDGSGACTGAAVSTYITQHLVALPAGTVTPLIYVCLAGQAASCATSGIACSTSTVICQCQPGRIVEVDMSYAQPLYFPIVGNFFQTNSNNTRLLSASAQATCEQ
jgi:Flp pilus assembly protein TadG